MNMETCNLILPATWHLAAYSKRVYCETVVRVICQGSFLIFSIQIELNFHSEMRCEFTMWKIDDWCSLCTVRFCYRWRILTHWGRVTHICWNIINWTFRNKLVLTGVHTVELHVQVKAYESIICIPCKEHTKWVRPEYCQAISCHPFKNVMRWYCKLCIADSKVSWIDSSRQRSCRIDFYSRSSNI